eukprot:scaffold304247_cov15-Prasinocladus_malaysianus.AAC.1
MEALHHLADGQSSSLGVMNESGWQSASRTRVYTVDANMRLELVLVIRGLVPRSTGLVVRGLVLVPQQALGGSTAFANIAVAF